MAQASAMHRWLPFGLILVLLIAFRVLGSAFPEVIPNFQPVAALFFCGALLATGWRGFAIAFGIWLLTYPLPTVFQGYDLLSDSGTFVTTLLAFVVIFMIGKSLRKRSIGMLLTGSLVAALVFHLITNGAAWIGDPRYVKSFTGFTQSLWSGLPNDPIPSWLFLRNLMAANFIFTTIFLSAKVYLFKPVELSSPHLAR